jgi:hypothetical protein
MNLNEQETQPIKEYRIPLDNGMTSLVDEHNYEYLMQWKWQAIWLARTASYHACRYGDGKLILMENVVMNRIQRRPQDRQSLACRYTEVKKENSSWVFFDSGVGSRGLL